MSTTNLRPSIFLRRVLWADVSLTGACGALMAAGAGPLAAVTQLPQALLAPAGLVLLGYIALVAAIARREMVPAVMIKLLIAINLLWALDVVAVLVWFSPNALGQAFGVVQILTVLVFAELQWMGMSRSGRVMQVG